MSSFKLEMYPQKLTRPAVLAFDVANRQFGEYAQQEISSNQWPWPTGDSPRDIVDDNDLRDSYDYQLTHVPWGRIGMHSWAARHAMANHEGAVFADGRIHPARRWTARPRDAFMEDFAAAMTRELAR